MTEDGFWAFSLAFYARPGVSAACLALQDEFGADVNLVLFALWCGTRGCRLDAAELTRLDRAVAPWRDSVVHAIRRARVALKPPPGPPFDPAAAEALRQQLLAAELAAERQQQAVMATLAPAPGGAASAAAAAENLACFARHAAIQADNPALQTLLGALA